MHIKATEITKRAISEIEVTHGDLEPLCFDGKMNYFGGYFGDLFESTNEYLESLPESVQLNLYKLYKEALTIMDPVKFGVVNARNKDDIKESRNYDYLIDAVEPIVAAILELLRPSNYENYNIRAGLTAAPKGLLETIRRGEYTLQMTVNLEDYSNLARLALLLRPLLPVFMKMMKQMDFITGKDYKELVTGGLISNNELIKRHPGWIKVVSYVRSTYQIKGISSLNLSVISEETTINRAIYIIVFNRLCACHVPSLDPSKDLAKQMYSIVRMFDATSSKVKEKELKGRDEQAERRGLHEIYQVKEEINSADIQRAAEYFTMNHYDERDNPLYKNRYVRQCMGLGIEDPELVDKVFDLIPSSLNYRLAPHVLQLLQLTLQDDISYELYMYLDFEQLKSAIALSAVKLQQLGYPHLSQIVMSLHDDSVEREMTSIIFTLNSTEEEALLARCKVNKTDSGLTTDNELVASVMSFLSSLGNGQWSSVIDLGGCVSHESIDEHPSGELYPVEMSPTIRTELISLITSN